MDIKTSEREFKEFKDGYKHSKDLRKVYKLLPVIAVRKIEQQLSLTDDRPVIPQPAIEGTTRKREQTLSHTYHDLCTHT